MFTKAKYVIASKYSWINNKITFSRLGILEPHIIQFKSWCSYPKIFSVPLCLCFYLHTTHTNNINKKKRRKTSSIYNKIYGLCDETRTTMHIIVKDDWHARAADRFKFYCSKRSPKLRTPSKTCSVYYWDK